jgi:hypothetical protein
VPGPLGVFTTPGKVDKNHEGVFRGVIHDAFPEVFFSVLSGHGWLLCLLSPSSGARFSVIPMAAKNSSRAFLKTMAVGNLCASRAGKII